MELTAKLRAALDEDERMAYLATEHGETWTYDGTHRDGPRVQISAGIRLSDNLTSDAQWWERGDVNSSVWTCDDYEDGCPGMAESWEAEGRHMARHDPARVLRQVAAMRKILDEHEIEEPGTDYQYCRSCQDHERHDAHSAPCPTLLALAEAYGIEP